MGGWELGLRASEGNKASGRADSGYLGFGLTVTQTQVNYKSVRVKLGSFRFGLGKCGFKNRRKSGSAGQVRVEPGPSCTPTLGSLRRLRTLDLGFNLLSGPIPPAIAGIPALSNLILCHNHLSGQIPPFPLSSSLVRLDLKRNSLSGEIPTLPPSLHYLSLASNGLSGPIDCILPRLARLNYLDLSMNHLSGEIPGQIFSFPISSLQLQRNDFSGPVRYLSLASNRLFGPIDRVLPRLARLNYLDLSMNHLSGQIPGQIFSFPISSLQLQRNNFSGPIRPAGSIPDRATVDLSYNRLTGPMPAALAAARRLYLDNNQFFGNVLARFMDRVVAGVIKVLYL